MAATKILIALVVAGAILALAAIGPTQTSAGNVSPNLNNSTDTTEVLAFPTSTPTSSYVLTPNIVYSSPEGVPQLADLYTPVHPGRAMPLVIYIHGGGWYS